MEEKTSSFIEKENSGKKKLGDDRNVSWHKNFVSREERESILNQKGAILLLTGLSASGKSTIATFLEKKLYENGKISYILDGDNLRHGLNSDLGFSREHREENLRRVREVAGLFLNSGIITILTLISPYREAREKFKEKFTDDYIEIFIDTSIGTCIARDPKGLYKKALEGTITNFTSINSPYEPPENPHIHINTEEKSIEEAVEIIYNYLLERKVIWL